MDKKRCKTVHTIEKHGKLHSQNIYQFCPKGDRMNNEVIKKQRLKTTLQKYLTNPSLDTVQISAKTKKVFASNNEALYITNKATGEQTPATGGATFVRREFVDGAQFIKLYSAGVKHLAQLTSPGFKIFQLIYAIMIENPNSDKLIIDFNDLSANGKFNESQKTFIRGINQLLEKEIIYQSLTTNVYFLNMNLFFNGDRINIVQSYELKKTKSIDKNQPELLEDF